MLARRIGQFSRAGLLLILSATLSAGCTPQISAVVPSATNAPTEQLEQVSVGDITPVISLAGVVQTSTPYDITSPANGVFLEESDGAQITTEEGIAVAVDFHELDRDTVALVPDNASVVKGLPVFSAVYAGYTLTAEVSGVNLLKLRTPPESVRAQIQDVGGPFDCKLLDERPSESADGIFVISCPVPGELDVLSGLPGVIALRYPSVKEVLTLPLAAVAGTFGSASVYVKVGSGVEVRNIEVGVNDGVRIEIKSGLKRDDVVYIPTPSLFGQ